MQRNLCTNCLSNPFVIKGFVNNNRFIEYISPKKKYATKQLPKNALAAEPKSINDLKQRQKYEVKKRSSAESLQTLRTVSFDEIRGTKAVDDLATVVIKDVAEVEKKKETINWEPSPLSDSSKLINQYLMLSKIRLTSKLSKCFNS